MAENTQYFEIVPAPEGPAEGLYCAGSGSEAIWFRKTEVSDAARSALEEVLAQWELVDKYEWSYENLPYEHKRSGRGDRVIPFRDLVFGGSYASNQVRGGCLLEGGVFVGVVLGLEDTSSYGMSVTKRDGFGVLLTDGRKIGRTSCHYFHCSTEIDESNQSDYSLRRRMEE